MSYQFTTQKQVRAAFWQGWELKEYGAWDDAELADHEQNLQRLLWLAAGYIMDNPPDDWEDCGCCGGAHPPEFTGDCRDDGNRWP